MKKFKTHQANLEAVPVTTAHHLSPLLQSKGLIQAVFVHYIPLVLVLAFTSLSILVGVASHLDAVPLALCGYVSLGICSLLYMFQKHLSFRAHKNNLKNVHYAFVGQQRYLWLMLSFVALISASLGVNALILTLLLMSLVINFARRRFPFTAGLVLAGTCGFPFALSSGNVVSLPGAIWFGILIVTLFLAWKAPQILRLDTPDAVR